MKKPTYVDPKASLKSNIRELHDVWTRSENLNMIKSKIKTFKYKLPIEY